MLRSAIPSRFNIPFGNSAGAGFIRPIPQASQIGIQAGAASLETGFPPVTFLPVGAGGTPPWGADFNGILNQETKWSQWLAAGGPVSYDGTFSTAIGGYPHGAILASATSEGRYWISIVDNNTVNPDGGPSSNWQGFSLSDLYSPDTGTTNDYSASFSPQAVAADVLGLAFRIKIANTNTGPSNLDTGSGPAAIVRRDGSALIGGELLSNRISEFAFNGTAFQLLGGPMPATAAAIAAGTDTQSAVTPAQVNPGFSTANPGYMKLPNGLIMQFGRTGTISSGTSVSLPLTFPNAALFGHATINGSPAAPTGITVTTTTVTLFSSASSAYNWSAWGF